MGNAKEPEPVTVDLSNNNEGKSSPTKKEKNKKRLISCAKVIFVLLGILAVTVALALIIVSILTCIATRAYDADQSSRVVAMVLLAVTGAVTICMVIYMQVAIFKKHSKPTLAAAVVILILIIVQALICGISVSVQPADEAIVVKSLIESFKEAKNGEPRHYKIWTMTQYDLNCCGVYGPEDYRSPNQPIYFPPNVPLSCCSNYDPGRSELVQEKEKAMCKAKKLYYLDGCKDLVVLVMKETATIVMTVAVTLIIVELVLLTVGLLLAKQLKKQENQVVPNPSGSS